MTQFTQYFFKTIINGNITIYDHTNNSKLENYATLDVSDHINKTGFNPLIGRQALLEIDFIDTTNHGVYAIESKGTSYYMLGVDATQNDILIITNDSFEVTALDTISDSTVVGLSFKDDDLYFSYRERIIKKWKRY